MALDPSIALNVRPIQVADPLAQYGQIAQLQNYQNQNALAQFQLGSAQRQEAAQNALSSAYQKAYNPDTGEVNNAMLVRGLAESGAGHLIPEVQTKMLAMQKERGLVKKTALETSGLEFKQNIDKANKAIQDIASLNNSEDAIASIDRHLANGVIDQQKADMLKANLGSAPSFGAWQRGMLTNILDAKEKLTFTAPKPTEVNLNNRKIFLDLNPNSPTFQTEVVPSQKVGMSPDASARLAFDQSKLAYERANPGFELKQGEDGTFYGVNKRTLQAVPVTVGGAMSPTGAPVGGGGIPTGRTAPADQVSVPPIEGASVAGTPFKGKHEGLKQIPANINLAIIKNSQGVQQLSDTIKLLEQNPNATGFKGFVPGAILNRADPEGVNARAGVADIGSLVMHERSGAAVTAAESPRLVPFIPLITDDNATALKKLKRMKAIIEGEQKGLTETYSKDQGYIPNPVVSKISAQEESAPQMPPMYATNGKERIMSTDGGQTWTPAK
jgi:hypothetical protein